MARLPPLNALKTLEAAGRLMSFTRAADELHVTPGAVSRQIRSLEDTLGFPLFERNHRDVRLTPESKAYVDALTDSFRQMERSTRRLLESRRQQPLYLHSAITFTLRWLVPRLVNYHALHPKQEIRLSTALPDPEELAASTDASLRIRTEAALAATPALVGHRLVDIDLVPVCSPHLLAKHALTKEGFREQMLLRSFARPKDWGIWLEAAGIDGVDPEGGICFESSSLAYQAAIEGIGIALGMKALVAADIAAGRLVVPYDFELKTETGFYMVYSRAASQHGALMNFRDWIVGEAEAKRPV